MLILRSTPIIFLAYALAAEPALAAHGGGGSSSRHTTHSYFTYTSTSASTEVDCVREGVIEGDLVRTTNSKLVFVKSVDGPASTCGNSEFPIRATFTSIPENLASRVLIFHSKAGIDLPDGWSRTKLTMDLRLKGFFFYAKNPDSGGTLLLRARKRAGVDDMAAFAKLQLDSTMANLKDVQKSDIEKLTIDGLPAWRFHMRGIIPASGKDVTSITTIIDAGDEIVQLDIPISTSVYQAQKDELDDLVLSITGLATPLDVLTAETTAPK